MKAASGKNVRAQRLYLEAARPQNLAYLAVFLLTLI